jgi:hypothetical protein
MKTLYQQSNLSGNVTTSTSPFLVANRHLDVFLGLLREF